MNMGPQSIYNKILFQNLNLQHTVNTSFKHTLEILHVCRYFLIQLLLHELTGRMVPCLETAAWYFAIFSLSEVDSSPLSDRPKAEEKFTLML